MAPVWLDVLDQTVRVCAAHRRADLAQRLQQKRAQLLDPTLRVVVVGERGQGKSQLVNALINAPVCPVGGARAPAVPIIVRHAVAPSAALFHSPNGGPPEPGEPGGPAEPGRPAVPAPGYGRTPVPLAELSRRITTGPARRRGAGPVHAEAGVPRGLLATGLVLVDTPGTDGDDDPPDGADPVGSPVRADVVVVVSDATRELSPGEINRLLRVTREHPYVVLALTKIDIVPRWRQVAEHNRQHLASIGVATALVPVSAALRLQAARADDRAVNAESGFPDLIARLMRSLHRKRDVLAPTSAGLLVGRTIEQLAAPLRAGLSGGTVSEPLARLHDAQRALDELQRRSSRWQSTLADEMASLRSDVEYDLRDRTRQILREVEEAFDHADPLRTWEPFQSWLDTALSDAVTANFDWLVQRCDWIAGRVADHFVPYEADLPPEWIAGLPLVPGEQVATIEQPKIERFTLVQKLYTGLRGSYLGVLVFGLATALAGMPLINPISVGAGVLFAGKSVRDESRSLLKRRQAVAKAAAQRHVEGFFLLLNKESKDISRWFQRTLRDHYTALTEQIQDGIVHSLRTAKQAAEADVVERDQRHRDLQRQMKQLAALYQRARELTAIRATPAAARLEPTR